MNLKRLAMKAITYKIGTFFVLFFGALWKTGSVKTALGWGLIDLVVKMTWFTLHEAMWTKFGASGQHVMLENLTLDYIKNHISSLPMDQRCVLLNHLKSLTSTSQSDTKEAQCQSK